VAFIIVVFVVVPFIEVAFVVLTKIAVAVLEPTVAGTEQAKNN
jgi:hypothetical protein